MSQHIQFVQAARQCNTCSAGQTATFVRHTAASYGISLEVNRFLRCMWGILQSKKAWVLADAAQENHERIQGQWQKESPCKEVLEQAKRSANTDRNAQIMRLVFECNEAWQLGEL